MVTTFEQAPAPKSGGLGAWWSRYGLSVAVILAMPLIFAVFSTVVGGLTPDSRCALCVLSEPAPPLAPQQSGTDLARAEIEAFVAAEAARLPMLTSSPLQWEWELPKTETARAPMTLAADDVRARYAYGVPTALLILASIPISIAAFSALPARPRFWRALAAGAVALAVILGLEFQDSHPVRTFTAEYLLGVLALSDYPLIDPKTWHTTFRIVDLATFAGMAATGSLIVVFAWLASARPREGVALSANEIRSHARTFRLALGLGSIVLILGVATTHGLFGWAPTMLAKAPREAVQSLASSASLYWGVIHSLTLLSVSVPAAMRLNHEIRLHAGEIDEGSAREIARDAGFTFDFKRIATTTLALAGPLLTGPALDLINAVSTAG